MHSKSERHARILEIVNNNRIETQEDIISILKRDGFDITQATVSRDIRELRLIKQLSDNGTYIYLQSDSGMGDSRSMYNHAMSSSVRSIDYALNQIVIKTHPGLAQAVAAGIDTLHDDNILGCVAGDDCIIVVARSVESVPGIVETIAAAFNIRK